MNEEELAIPISIDSLITNHEKFLRFLSSRVADRAAAEDILQSAYVKALESAQKLRRSESIVAWTLMSGTSPNASGTAMHAFGLLFCDGGQWKMVGSRIGSS